MDAKVRVAEGRDGGIRHMGRVRQRAEGRARCIGGRSGGIELDWKMFVRWCTEIEYP